MKQSMRYVPLWLAGFLFAGVTPAGAATVKLTGWFACDKCTAAKVAKGEIRPSNPVCAKECIDKGDEAVFLSEQGKESLKVRKYTATEDLGYHVEVTGVIDGATKTIAIESVKRLSYDGASCARPRSATKKYVRDQKQGRVCLRINPWPSSVAKRPLNPRGRRRGDERRKPETRGLPATCRPSRTYLGDRLATASATHIS